MGDAAPLPGGPDRAGGNAGAGIRRHGSTADLLRAVGLVAAISLAWCLAYGRTTASAWRVPVDYVGDSLGHTLAYLKASADGHAPPFGPLMVPELGAPFAASWNDFPRQHRLQFWAAGFLARRIGLFLTANVLLLLAHVLAGLSFYAVARYFRARWEWALAGALAFGLSPFLFYRSLPHLNLSFDWPIPLGVLVVTWCFARRGLAPGTRRFRLALVIAAVTGLHHLYYIAMLGQFLLLASLVQLLRRAGRTAVLSPLLVLTALVAGAAFDNEGTLAYAWQHGPNPGALVRPYGNVERFALKPVELLLPRDGTGVVPWRSLSASYYSKVLYKGEFGSAYLGIAGLGALAWLVFSSLRVRPGGRPLSRGTKAALLFILTYSVVGGINGFLGFLGFVWFRATNRFSIWILALLLLWGTVRLSRASWTRHRPASVLAAALVCALVYADQVPPAPTTAEIDRVARRVASDRALANAMEASLPRGAMVFQLPVVDCPEGPRIGHAEPHDHMRPYLQSTGLRFSYGSDKGRPREAWQHRVEALTPDALAEALERIGFSGLLVDRKAYADGGQDLRERLAASGRREAWDSWDGDFLFVRLRPAARPAAPDAVVPAGQIPALPSGPEPAGAPS